jgi:hypothetical protein
MYELTIVDRFYGVESKKKTYNDLELVKRYLKYFFNRIHKIYGFDFVNVSHNDEINAMYGEYGEDEPGRIYETDYTKFIFRAIETLENNKIICFGLFYETAFYEIMIEKRGDQKDNNHAGTQLS